MTKRQAKAIIEIANASRMIMSGCVSLSSPDTLTPSDCSKITAAEVEWGWKLLGKYGLERTLGTFDEVSEYVMNGKAL